MIRDLLEKVDNMQKQMVNVSRVMAILRKKSRKIARVQKTL